jgi:protein-L-isoaspartate O-methyltransferase
MALMLEALEVQPGDHLLEIGTGSGYNAALLGNLVSDHGSVVTVERTPALVAAAAERLSHLPWVMPVVADGLYGYPDAAPYQRIIATGASMHIPHDWVGQLTVGGILIGSLALCLGTSTPVYRLVKDQQGGACGSFLPNPAFFMGLSKADDASSSVPDFAGYEAMPVYEHAWTTLDMPHLLKDPGLACWIRNSIPGLQGHLRADMPGAMTVHPCYLLPGRALLTCLPSKNTPTGFEIEVYGQVPLWTLLLAAYHEWENRGRPGIEHYHLLVDRDGSLNLVLR